MASFAQDHGVFVSDRIDIETYTGANFAYTGTAGQSAVLPEGLYDVSSDQACFIKVGPTANDVTADDGYRLLQNNVVTLLVRPGSRIGAIQATTGGTLWLHKVG